MPVAAAMDLIVEPGRPIAVRSSCSIVAKGMYSRIVFTSYRISAAAGGTFTFFLPEYKKRVKLSNIRDDKAIQSKNKQHKAKESRIIQLNKSGERRNAFPYSLIIFILLLSLQACTHCSQLQGAWRNQRLVLFAHTRNCNFLHILIKKYLLTMGTHTREKPLRAKQADNLEFRTYFL